MPLQPIGAVKLGVCRVLLHGKVTRREVVHADMHVACKLMRTCFDVSQTLLSLGQVQQSICIYEAVLMLVL